MEQYDEELYENIFFQTIQHSFSNLLDLVSVSGWIVLVPCKTSLRGLDLTLDNIESHVVKAQEDDPSEFYTLNKKELIIRSGIIITGQGFNESRQARILFEELFYNNEEGSYRVLCIDRPLEGGEFNEERNYKATNGFEVAKSKKSKIDISKLNFEDSCQHLWGYPRSSKAKYQLTRTLDQLSNELNSCRGISLEELIDKVKKTFENLVKFLVNTPQFKKSTSHYGMFLALETFIMHRIYRQLMRLIGLHGRERDFKLNKFTRNVTSCLQLEHLGINVSIDVSNLERSRIILNNFTRHITPSAKVYHLRKMFYSLLYSLPAVDSNFSIMTSDELIPVCAFLIAKSTTNNWWCHLILLRNFCFSVSHFDQELEYFLTTLEASMVYLMSEKVDPFSIWIETVLPSDLLSMESPLVKDIFQCILDNNLKGLEELKVKVGEGADDDPSGMCHPLCSCARCCKGGDAIENVNTIKLALQVFNGAGFTALHVSCIMGHHDIVDWLLSNGSKVNEKTVSGCQPLHLACGMGFQVLVLLLLSHGADICALDNHNNNPLHTAVYHGHLQCVKALIFVDQPSRKLDLNSVNNQFDTPLHIAARWGYEDICECLLESGASCLKRNKQHLLPSELASNLHLCHLILKAVTEEGKMDALAKRKFSLGSRKNDHITFSRNSLQPDLEFSLTQSFSESSLSSPISSSFSSSSSSKLSQARRAKRLNEASPFSQKVESSRNSYPEDGDDDDDATIYNSLPHGKHSNDSPSKYIGIVNDKGDKNNNHGDDLDGGGDDGDSQKAIKELLTACKEGNIDKVKLLLHWSEYEEVNPEVASIDITKVQLCHPLCQCEKCAHAQWLSPSNRKPGDGVNINVTSEAEGLSPLHVSCRSGHVELTRLLLMRGASVDRGGGPIASGSFPIHMACQQPSAGIVSLLIQYGADVNALDGFDNSVLHLCSLYHFYEHTILLLLFNAKTSLINIKGHDPLYYALRSTDFKMTFLLLLFGAVVSKCTYVPRVKSMQLRRALAEGMLLRKSLDLHLPHSSKQSCLRDIVDGLPFKMRKRSRSMGRCSRSGGGVGTQQGMSWKVKDDSNILQSNEAIRRCSLLF